GAAEARTRGRERGGSMMKRFLYVACFYVGEDEPPCFCSGFVAADNEDDAYARSFDLINDEEFDHGEAPLGGTLLNWYVREIETWQRPAATKLAHTAPHEVH